MKDILSTDITARFSNELPADPEKENFSRQVYEACFSYAETKKPRNPELVHFSSQLLHELGLGVENEEDFTNVMSGAEKFNGFKSYAMCYGGHQFGNWAGQLGDGRAINIAEIDANGSNWKLQLKGAGPTPYSRGSDGLAVLRSSIREYLCSEAMHSLGVPTTRALSLVKTGDLVTRDILYNGNPKDEIGAVVCRIAPSFIRFGSFQIFAARSDTKNLKKLFDYTIKQHYPELGEPSKETYLLFLQEVVNRTMDMVIHWQRVGFVHGVMNTDNMSILGLTIDYGPYGWLEDYDPQWTPNTTDAQHRRYRFGNQANMALWNLTQLANAMYPLIEEVAPLQEILEASQLSYTIKYREMMASKVGLSDWSIIGKDFFKVLEENLTKSEIDYTLFFRELSCVGNSSAEKFWEIVQKASYFEVEEMAKHKENWMTWHTEYADYLITEGVDEAERAGTMKSVNPKYVLRNYMAQLAIDEAEKGNNSLVIELYDLLLNPYEEQPTMEKWYAKRPEWARHKVGCSMLSCSS
jgi:serine/tyrosine/threonine adenylyltransferase